MCASQLINIVSNKMIQFPSLDEVDQVFSINNAILLDIINRFWVISIVDLIMADKFLRGCHYPLCHFRILKHPIMLVSD